MAARPIGAGTRRETTAMSVALTTPNALHAPALPILSVPLAPELLNSTAMRQAARDMTDGLMTGVPETMPLYALLTALAGTFVALCDDHDIDAQPAFAQIAGTLARDPEAVGARETIGSDMAHLLE